MKKKLVAPVVSIHQPLGPVAQRFIATGLVSPTDTPVQVLVKARDGLWYLQTDAVVEQSRWLTPVCLGVPETPPGTVFSVVAVAGTRMEQSHLDLFNAPVHPQNSLNVQGAVFSNTILVTRL